MKPAPILAIRRSSPRSRLALNAFVLRAARLLPSGAGHDTMIMGQLCPAGMLFLRCKGGISHNPEESITTEDAEIGLAALVDFTRRFKAP